MIIQDSHHGMQMVPWLPDRSYQLRPERKEVIP
jgi:hypothetical protein